MIQRMSLHKVAVRVGYLFLSDSQTLKHAGGTLTYISRDTQQRMLQKYAESQLPFPLRCYTTPHRFFVRSECLFTGRETRPVGASTSDDILKIRLQLTKPVTWIPLIWGVLCGAAASGICSFHPGRLACTGECYRSGAWLSLVQ